MKPEPVPRFSLYVITDPVLGRGRSAAEQAAAAARGGAGLVQVRDKTRPPGLALDAARAAGRALAALGVPWVLNDWPWLAPRCGASGIHVGQDDCPVEEVRRLAPGCFVGKSTHSLEQVRRALDEGPDYLALGPVYPTATKRRGSPPVGLAALEEAAKIVTLPWVAIGGIHAGNLDDVLRAGATRVAVVSAAVGAPDIEAACRDLVGRMRRHGLS